MGKWGSGGTPKRTNKDYYNGDIPWFVIGDLNDGIVTESKSSITELGVKNSSAKLIEKGTLLIAMYGSIGKLGIAGFQCTTNQAIAHCVVNDDLVSRKYLFYYLKSRRDHLLSIGKGAAQQNISQTVLKAYDCPIAPLNEQNLITDKLDSTLAKVDQVQEHLEKVRPILKRFRQSVLAAATSGDLTREWRGNSEVSEPWDKVKLIDVVVSKPRNGKSPKGVDFDTGIKNLTLSAITPGYFVDNKYKFVDLEVPNDSHLWVKSGDILIQRANSIEYVGVSALYEGEDNKYIYPDLIMKCRASNKILPKFLYYSLSSEIVRQYFRENATGTAGNMPKINQPVVSAAPIQLPSLAEQVEIVRRIESLFSLANIVEKQYSDAKARTNRLTQSILAKAFRGELVPQNPTDEPASILLKRVKVDLEADKKKKTVRKPKKTKGNEADTAQQITSDLFEQLEESSSVVNAAEAKDSLRIQYQEQIEKAQSTLEEAKFTVEQFRSVIDFKGDYDSLKALVMNLLKGIPGLSEPLLAVDDWDVKNGDYLLRLLEAK
ncbi:restriction endonuclease subunit S [Vibrio splendidus]